MDNASKALIMAGAVLISIAIVGVGVYIFSSTSSITETGQAQMDAASLALANSTLRQYVGSNVRGTQVIELIDYLRVLNANGAYPTEIKINGAAATSKNPSKNATYNISIGTNDIDANSGYITNFTITTTAGAAL